MTTMRRSLLAAMAAILGCSDAEPGGDDCLAGHEACACAQGDVCLAGLDCLSGLCVDAGAWAGSESDGYGPSEDAGDPATSGTPDDRGGVGGGSGTTGDDTDGTTEGEPVECVPPSETTFPLACTLVWPDEHDPHRLPEQCPPCPPTSAGTNTPCCSSDGCGCLMHTNRLGFHCCPMYADGPHCNGEPPHPVWTQQMRPCDFGVNDCEIYDDGTVDLSDGTCLNRDAGPRWGCWGHCG